MSKVYKSPYEAYPFLRDPSASLLCDFELMTDRMASATGLLRAEIREYGFTPTDDSEAARIYLSLDKELAWVGEMIYHLNACLRTRFTLEDQEFSYLVEQTERINGLFTDSLSRFVLPAGTVRAMQAHLLRVDAKSLVRLLYRHAETGAEVDHRIIDWANLLSGYFFMLSLLINHVEGRAEETFSSRNY